MEAKEILVIFLTVWASVLGFAISQYGDNIESVREKIKAYRDAADQRDIQGITVFLQDFQDAGSLFRR